MLNIGCYIKKVLSYDVCVLNAFFDLWYFQFMMALLWYNCSLSQVRYVFGKIIVLLLYVVMSTD